MSETVRSESLLEMELRHARERAELIERLCVEHYTAGLHDRTQPGHAGTPRSLMEQITEKVAQQHQVLPSELRGPSRLAHLIEPRRQCWVELKQHNFTLIAIARFFGRDHSTICTGIQDYEKQQQEAV
ncbi:helix-turn-helix domain-containing protein [Leisingera sp. ANG-M7]|uniref:helix-turn-helix domain-containing protein n=1 Tax=Leisingera sp. ANG-M7 TaxID=1577902 RepID=UPI00057FAC04|nr:helix-turn-helix domain-containing protein [Leisingera sp. ANG-M7]KIC36532.1 hypothetical protein RA26_12410 [Leisingera sp. ANG-M7]